MSDFSVIVTDTSPLITLAKADELDLLLRLGVTVRIPDIVYLEATRADDYPDAARIAAWVQTHDEQVRIAATTRVKEWQILKENGERARGYGELAAIEVVSKYAGDQPGMRHLLLYEDSDMNRFAVRANVEMATTGTFLAALEEAQLIQSADRILDQAAAAGRNVDQQRAQPGNADIAEAFRSWGDRPQGRDRGFER